MRSHRQSFLISAESLLCLHSRVPLLQHQQHHTRHGASPPLLCAHLSSHTSASAGSIRHYLCNSPRRSARLFVSCLHAYTQALPSFMAHRSTIMHGTHTNTSHIRLHKHCTSIGASMHAPTRTCTQTYMYHPSCMHTHTRTHTHTHTHTHLISLSRCLDLCSK